MICSKSYLVIICFLCLISNGLFAQNQKLAESLAVIYKGQQLSDTAKMELLRNLCFNETKDLNTAIQYADKLIVLSTQVENESYLRMAYFLKGTKKRLQGNLEEALNAFFKSADIARTSHHFTAEGEAHSAIADTYTVANNFTTAKIYYNKALTTLRQAGQKSSEDSISLASVLNNAGDAFLRVGNFDSALLYSTEAKLIFEKVDYESGRGYSLGNIGMVYASMGKDALGEKNINEAISILEQTQDYYPICVYLVSMADIYLNKGDEQRALTYALRSLKLAGRHGFKEQIAAASLKLSALYNKAAKYQEAFKYYQLHITYRDSLNNISNVNKMADLRTNFIVSQKDIEVNLLKQQKKEERKFTAALGIILVMAMIILIILWRNNQHKQKAYKILDLQKQETEIQKAKVELTLSQLQLTQKQLIQSAKMVSLGELTAGIAHEIQNPLNFVNNFSEVSVELLDELTEVIVNKLSVADKEEATDIIKYLADNLTKINTHSKRADAIVKSMQQHSLSSTGKREPTDINALADDYLRLSYHGIHAKDKSFKVDFKTDFDDSIGSINVVPQEIGRVLLNLYNNAFYALNEKKKQGITDFVPQILITTKTAGSKIELSIKDNGTGVSPHVLDKIFQPFFTTKPAGQGTGLGLSLSYDIVVAHGGELNVETTEGEFTKFTLQLPRFK